MSGTVAYGPWYEHRRPPEPGTRYEFEDFVGARWEATLSSWCSVPMENVDGFACVGVRLNFDDHPSFETNMPIRFREVIA